MRRRGHNRNSYRLNNRTVLRYALYNNIIRQPKIQYPPSTNSRPRTSYINNEKRNREKDDSQNINTEEINLKIEELKQRIEEKIKERKDFIAKNIFMDEKCFNSNENDLIILKEDFINYLVDKAENNFIKRRKLKKHLNNLRFNLEKGNENVLIEDRKSIFSPKRNESVVKLPSLEWDKWNRIIELIGENINNYKLNLKREKLNTLYDKYEEISKEKPDKNFTICEKCGAENLKEAIYCHYCGNKL